MGTDWRIQLAGLSACWLAVAVAHFANDGLWYQGDAPRHAANGLLLLDLAHEPTWDVRDYVLSYYVRYPVINPRRYPPLFYGVEAVAYGVAGRSPWVAKSCTLAFAALGGWACWWWLRRWVSAAAGWGALFWILAPGVVVWSHAVMLNVPSAAMGLWTACGLRRWLEQDRARLCTALGLWAGLLTLLGVSTYYHNALLFAVAFAWTPLLVTNVTRRRKLWLLLAVAIVVGLPALFQIWKLSGVEAAWRMPPWTDYLSWRPWTYYLRKLPGLISWPVIAGAVISWVSLFWRRENDRRSAVSLTWFAVTWLALTVLPARDTRYGLLLVGPIVVGAMNGWQRLCLQYDVEPVDPVDAPGVQVAANRPPFGARFRLAWPILFGALAVAAWQAAATEIPRVTGYRAVASFVHENVQDEPILYDGHHNGIFSYYVLAADKERRNQVLLGNKSFYTYAGSPGWKHRSFVASEDDVIRLLQTELGCRWLAVEYGRFQNDAPEMTLLREVVQRDEFEKIAKFPIEGFGVERVDVYRLRLPVEPQKQWKIPMQSLGDGSEVTAAPLPPRTGGLDDRDRP